MYDERNTAFGPEGTAGQQYAEVWKGAEPEGALRRVAWQRITEWLAEGELAYLASGLEDKYMVKG